MLCWLAGEPGNRQAASGWCVTMIVLLNGAFGVGKSTVSRLLWQRLNGSRIYDPEWVGSALMRLSRAIKLRGAGTDDFQDIDLWRRSVVRGTQLVRAVSLGTVIVPMAFGRRDYFDEVVTGIRKFDDDVRAFCLRAGLVTIEKRLRARGEKFDHESGEWVLRKTQQCIEAHSDPHFGEPIETEILNSAEVADQILHRLDCKSS